MPKNQHDYEQTQICSHDGPAHRRVAADGSINQRTRNSTGGNSPHETTGAVVDGNRVTITYGRPSMKGREIWGKLVPYGKVWRTGSDEATILITQKPITIGDVNVPAGRLHAMDYPARRRFGEIDHQ